MDKDDAVRALGALAHPGRLDVFRMLVQAGPDGMAAGECAGAAASPRRSRTANVRRVGNAGEVT